MIPGPAVCFWFAACSEGPQLAAGSLATMSAQAHPVQVNAARERGKPYTIVFVGVNGVGKSTNLAKICYWLLQNDVKVRRQLPIMPAVLSHDTKSYSRSLRNITSRCKAACGVLHVSWDHREGSYCSETLHSNLVPCWPSALSARTSARVALLLSRPNTAITAHNRSLC